MKAAVLVLAAIGPIGALGAQAEIAPVGPELSFSVKGARSYAAYCPDNTCEEFSVGGDRLEVIKHFAEAYLYGVSQYVYLREFQARDLRAYMQTVAILYGALCPDQTSAQTARCVAMHLAKRYKIKVSAVRYDEKTKHVERIRFRGGLMQSNLQIDTDPCLQEAASPQMLVVRSFSR